MTPERVAAMTIKELDTYINELEVQCKFWRQAAENAVNGWNALEDKVAAAGDALDAIVSNVAAARELLDYDEPAPIDELTSMLQTLPDVDLGDGVKLRVVEDERPISFPRMSDEAEKQED